MFILRYVVKKCLKHYLYLFELLYWFNCWLFCGVGGTKIIKMHSSNGSRMKARTTIVFLPSNCFHYNNTLLRLRSVCPWKKRLIIFFKAQPSTEQLFQDPCNFLSRQTLSYAHNLNSLGFNTLFSHFSPCISYAIIKQLYRKNSNGEDKHPRWRNKIQGITGTVRNRSRFYIV